LTPWLPRTSEPEAHGAYAKPGKPGEGNEIKKTVPHLRGTKAGERPNISDHHKRYIYFRTGISHTDSRGADLSILLEGEKEEEEYRDGKRENKERGGGQEGHSPQVER